MTFLKRLWEVLGGSYPDTPPRDIPIVTSLCYYSLTFTLGRLLCAAINQTSPKRLRSYLLDFVVTFQLMACSLENMHIRTHYGIGGYIAVMFSVAMWSVLTIKEGKSNPCAYVLHYMQGKVGKWDVLLRMCLQTCGALLSYKYARMFWSLGISEVHRRRYVTMYCTTDLKILAPLGFGVEFGGTLFDCLLSLSTFTPFFLCEMATKCLLGCFITIAGLSLTGFYLNPVNATNQTFGCHGASHLEFFLVYWVAPISATVLGVKMHASLREITKTALATRDDTNNQCEVCGKIHGPVTSQTNSLANSSQNGLENLQPLANGVGSEKVKTSRDNSASVRQRPNTRSRKYK